MMSVAPIYDAYAVVYDAIGQGRFSARLAEWALQWLAARGERPERVLELACGAGDAALVFAAAGCAVVGVDRSRPMLEIARGKARDQGYAITFVEGDIRDRLVRDERRKTEDVSLVPSDAYELSSFILHPSSFDLVTCFYDSMNYLIDDGDLGRVFAGVAAALRSGGYLVCDMNTAAEYATWDDRDVVTYDGRDCMVYNQLCYDPATRLGIGRIVWFVREIDDWWRGEETHTERAWSDAEVHAALENAGLTLVAQLAPDGSPATDDAPRVVYVARRQH
jgi:SAM-dependent methyltransferase